MDSNTRDMINGLFEKLKQAETQSEPREAEAEALIRNTLASQPNAPYYMAQAILVQEHALNNLNQRVQELEQEIAKRPAGGGGFLGGLFGAGSQNTPARTRTAANAGPFQNAPSGSFLGGAMQTAVGVAGGMMLASALGGMFAGDEAQAAEPVATEEPAMESADAWEDDGGFEEDI